MRNLWDQLMIVLMGSVIFFCLREMWNSSEPFQEGRCLFGLIVAPIVIVLKVQAMRAAKTRSEESRRSKV